MEIEWDARPNQHRVDPRGHWHDHQQPPPMSFPPPQPQPSPPSLVSQRRRSSAANSRPAGPPPNLPIPSLPQPHANALTHNTMPEPADLTVHPSNSNSLSRASRSSSFARPTASPSLSAVAAFSQARQASSSNMQHMAPPMHSSIDDLSDPPPQSYFATSAQAAAEQAQENHAQGDRGLLAPPTDQPHRSEHRPSSRRALTRALELAREAVQLDSTNDNPEAAVNAYAQSVALLSEVMERVRNGEDSTTDAHRRRRRRSVAAQEEEVRRLQNIHDTYADRMNILSIIYSIPAVPYPTTSLYGNSSVSTDSTSYSPTASTSPSIDNSPHIPQQVYTHHIPEESAHAYPSQSSLYEDVDQSTDNDGVYTLDESVLIGTAISGPSSMQHPYSVPYEVSHQAQSSPNPAPARISSQISRRSRAPSNLPPKAPPPAASLPPAPGSAEPPSQILGPAFGRQEASGETSGHRRTPSNLESLPEENDDASRLNSRMRDDTTDIHNHVPDTPRTLKRESPPLPPLPLSPDLPRNASFSKAPPSPRLQTIASNVRPRAIPQQPLRHEPSAPQLSAVTQGSLLIRRKTSAPSSTRSPSPTESTTSTGSSPPNKTALPPLPNGHISNGVRSRSSSQPGRRPSVGGGRTSPDQRPPLPNAMSNGTARKVSVPSKLNPQLSNLQVDNLTSYTVGGLSSNLPTTPISPLPPVPPSDPVLKPYHMMNLLRNTMISPTGGYVTRRLHVPCEVWSQGGAKLTGLDEKIRVVAILCSALEELQTTSAEQFGAGNVSSGLALGIGSIGKKEVDIWLTKLDDFSNVCDHVVANFGKKLGVGEGFVSRKPTWGGKLFSRFDKFTNGKNLDSPAAYVQGLKKLFAHAQLLDEHTRAVNSQPIAPAYGNFPVNLQRTVQHRLKRFSEFFATVVLTFVIRDLSQLLDKYVKKCEKWLAE